MNSHGSVRFVLGRRAGFFFCSKQGKTAVGCMLGWRKEELQLTAAWPRSVALGETNGCG